jgi:hypothetical protein
MRPWILLICFIVAGGCAGYKLGPTNGMVSGSRTIAFRPFANLTKEPRITEYLNASLRQQLQRDGTFHLETAGQPDIIVSGEVVRFGRSALSYETNDVLTPQEYTLTISAHVVAVNTTTGRTNFDRLVQGYTYIHVFNDQTSVERQSIPLLTDSLAHNAVALLADGDW